MARRRRVTSWSNNSVMQFPTHILHRDRERERERERERKRNRAFIHAESSQAR